MPLAYLGFQRAPPRAAVAGDVIKVAPTICNDLRDHVYVPEDGPVTLRLVWLADSSKGKAKGSTTNACSALEPAGEHVEAQWTDAASAFRLVSIRVPAGIDVRSINTLRLAIFVALDTDGAARKKQRTGAVSSAKRTGPRANPAPLWTFDLQTPAKGLGLDGACIMPCLSEPVQLLRQESSLHEKEKGAGITRSFFWGTGPARSLLINEESGFALDKHLWDASIHMSRWLLIDGGLDMLQLGTTSVEGRRPLHITELGAGTGLLSILVAALARRACTITATDLPSALSLLSANIAANKRFYAPGVHVSATALDWCEVSPGTLPSDVVLVSDCTYNPSSFAALSRAIATLLQPRQSNTDDGRDPRLPVCVLAKKHRHADEEALWCALADAGLVSSLLCGADGAAAADAATPHAASQHARHGWGLYTIRHRT